jgi:hypothetical protein
LTLCAVINAWLERFREFWAPRLDALETELARGRRRRRVENNEPRKGDP